MNKVKKKKIQQQVEIFEQSRKLPTSTPTPRPSPKPQSLSTSPESFLITPDLINLSLRQQANFINPVASEQKKEIQLD